MNTPSIRMPYQPHVWRLQQAMAQVRARLTMSDYWFLFGLCLALFYVADPFEMRFDKIGITKHLPLMFSLGGAILINIGALLFPSDPTQSYTRRGEQRWRVLAAAWPLALLGLWIVIASIYTRKSSGINNTFVVVGIYMLFGLLTARVVMLSQARAAMVKAFLYFATFASIFMMCKFVVYGFDESEVSYHEMEALVVPLAVYFSLRPMKSRFWRYSLTMFFLLAGIAFMKNTGYIVLALTLAYLWMAEWRFRFRESFSFRFWTLFWVVVLAVVAVAVYGALAYQRGSLLPTGNPQYRLHTYELAWNRFVESPLWGTGFTGAATEKFTGYQIKSAKGILATHSDILDLAAQGGLLALCLWIWGYVRIMRLSLRHILRERPRDDSAAAAHALACMSLTSIFVYAFNPILLQPVKALLLWGQLGMLLGLALHRANSAAAAAQKSGVGGARFPIHQLNMNR